MEAKELMIGDWVSHKGTYVKIEDITTNSGRYKYPLSVFYSDGREFAHIAVLNVDPIPLTEEILLKNGFIWYGNTESWVHRAYPKLEAGVMKTHEKDKIFAWVSSYFKRIEYVHEFQHLLRLCGLSDLADKLKIE